MLIEALLAVSLLSGTAANTASDDKLDPQAAETVNTAVKDAEPLEAKAVDTEADKVKCRYVKSLNSRIPAKVCRTLTDWAEIERQNREAVESSRRNRGTTGNSGTIDARGGD